MPVTVMIVTRGTDPPNRTIVPMSIKIADVGALARPPIPHNLTLTILLKMNAEEIDVTVAGTVKRGSTITVRPQETIETVLSAKLRLLLQRK